MDKTQTTLDLLEIGKEKLLSEKTNPELLQIASLLTPRIFSRLGAAHANKKSFVHYTTAETAVKFFKNKQLRLRNPRVMNDVSELQYGHNLFTKAYPKIIKEFTPHYKNAYGAVFENTASEIIAASDAIKQEVSIACFSEIDLASKLPSDQFGRLSMWRAYGGKAGIGIVFNRELMLAAEDDLVSAFTMPVQYDTVERFNEECMAMVARFTKNPEILKTVSQEDFDAMWGLFYLACTVGTKHPSFEEEQEWRLVHRPIGKKPKANPIKAEVETMEGIPQVVHKLHLEEGIKSSAGSLSFQELIERVIIGPTNYPEIIRKALEQAMVIAGFHEPAKKITVSNIPLRLPE